MTSSVADQHPQLCGLSVAATAELSEFGARLDRFDGVDHEQHSFYLGRAARLGDHLRSVLLLAEQGLYASAFVLLRTAFEHQLQDRLLHLGRRYSARHKVSDAAWQALQAEYSEQRTRWARTVAEEPVRDDKGVVTLVYRGIAEAGSDPATSPDLLHPIYFKIVAYSPTVGRPGNEGRVEDGVVSTEVRERLARNNRDIWNKWLSWPAVRRNLELNGLFAGRDLIGVDVHYAFLSGFTHATNAAYDAAHGHWGSSPWPDTAHFAEELVHLYVANLAAAELVLLSGMEDRAPPVRIGGRDGVDDLVARAEAAAAHLSFPGGRPHTYDRVSEGNRRHWRAHRAGEGPPSAEPCDAEIPYYDDPLTRLRSLHQSIIEGTTGLAYESPWPYPASDAW